MGRDCLLEPEQQAALGPEQSIEWIARGNFAAILDRLCLSLVLSAGPDQIIFLGAIDGELTATATLMAHNMGLAVESRRMAVASARTIIVFSNASRLAAHYPSKRDYYDAFFIPRMVYFTGGCHMHDMVFQDEAIIGVNTNFSCICRVDGKFSFTPLWTPPFITQLRAEDRCHLNGFTGYAGEPHYLTALAATDTAGGWREMPDTVGILIDAQKNAILRSDLCMPHSPRIIHDQLYVLNGGEGEVLRVDRASGRGTVMTRLPGFTHGLCEHAGVLFVGMSRNRASRRDRPPPIAQRLELLIAGVAAIEERTGEILGMLEFSSGVTEIYDVQVLPSIRRAGMQNLVATDGFIGIETPHMVFWTKRSDDDPVHFSDVADGD